MHAQGFQFACEMTQDGAFSELVLRSIPDEYKPVIFADGVRQPFPPPTRKIKRPVPARLKLR